MSERVVGGVPRAGSVLSTAAEVLVRPGEFFASRPDPSLRTAAGIVLVSGLAHGLPGVALTLAVRHLFETAELARRLGFVVGFSLLAVAATWVVVTVLLYLASYPAARRGGGRRLLAYAAWGMVPTALLSLVTLVVTLGAIQQFGVPATEATVDQFARQFREAPLVALASAAGTANVVVTGTAVDAYRVAGWLSILWSAYVWMAAVERARGLSRRLAAVVAAVPVAVRALLAYLH